MIKQIFVLFFAVFTLCGHPSFAKEEPYSPPPGRLFHINVNNATLTITTTIPDRCYQFAGIKSLTPHVGFLNSSGSKCTPNANGYCLFRVCNKSPATFDYSGPGGSTEFILCLNGNGSTSSCEKFQRNLPAVTAKYAYVAGNTAHDVWQCPVQFNGSFSNCSILTPAETPPGYTPWGGPYNVAFTKVSGSEYAFISDGNANAGEGTGQVYSCLLNTSNGTFTSCVSTIATFSEATQTAFLTVAGTQYAYVADNFPANVWQCMLSPSNALLINCQTLSGAPWGRADGVTIKQFSNTSYAYISTGSDHKIYQCSIDATDGTFVSCASTPTTAYPWYPLAIAFQSAGGTLYAYIAESRDIGDTGQVWRCNVNPNGSFRACSPLNPKFIPSTTRYDGATGIAFATESGVTHAYVSDAYGTGLVFKCSLNSNGTFNTCSPTPHTSTWDAYGVGFYPSNS